MAENLVLRLIARTTSFEKRMGRATKKTALMKVGVVGLGGAMKRMAGILAATAGVGGMGLLIKSQFAAIDANAKLSDRLGVTTQKLVALQHAGKIMGVETGTMNKSLEIFSKRLGEVQFGTGEAKRALEALGLSAAELANRTPDEAIGIVADQIKNLGTQSEKAAAANFLFGRSGMQLLNLFEEGSEGIAAYQKEVEKLGMTYSRMDARAVEEANDAITKLKGSLTGFASALAVSLGPSVTKFVDLLTRAANHFHVTKTEEIQTQKQRVGRITEQIKAFQELHRVGMQIEGGVYAGKHEKTIEKLVTDRRNAVRDLLKMERELRGVSETKRPPMETAAPEVTAAIETTTVAIQQQNDVLDKNKLK